MRAEIAADPGRRNRALIAQGGIDANVGRLDAITAVVLGGTSLFGGLGSIIGKFLAVILLQVLRNIFNLLGLGSFYQMTTTGIMIVVAILLNRFIDMRRGRG